LGKNLHLLKQKKMKTKLILVLIMLIGFFQSAVAQDFSAFYQAIEGTAKAKYNDKTGCEFSSKDDLVFKPLTESTLDIRFEMKCLEKDAEDAIVYIRVGNEQQVEFEVSFKDGLTTKVNGEMIKNNYVAHEMSEEGSGNVEFHSQKMWLNHFLMATLAEIILSINTKRIIQIFIFAPIHLAK
jgi:hypothetical protein